jgi:hypothetical protein
MKALTIYQPWATLIALEVKPYEFRGWDYSSRYPSIAGARIVVHASARPVKIKEIVDLIERMGAAAALDRTTGGTGLKPDAMPLLGRIYDGMMGKGPAVAMPLAAAICTATIGKAVRADTLFGGRPGNDNSLWAWPMLAVKPCAPVPCKGLQGFWNFPPSLERDI